MISTLDHAPTAAPLQSYPKCICKSEEHRVHALEDDGPLCGGGHGGSRVQEWQTDIGPINCGACLSIIARRNQP